MNAPNHSESTALAVAARQQFDLSPQTFDQALTFANYLAESDLVPKDFKGKPGNCLIAVQWGAELGLKPMQALQNLAIINGRPSLWGDAVIALVRSSPVCEYVTETDDGHTATCRVKRRGDPAEQVRTFSMDDAKAAGLQGKAGPWTQYPRRMRQMRARAFALRDVFPDVLRGLPVAEEVMDTPTEKHMGPAEVVQTAGGAQASQALAQQQAGPEPWPDEALEKRFPQWCQHLAKGKTHDDIIAFARTKGALSEAQIKKIRALTPVDAAQDVTPKGEQQQSAPAVTYAAVADKIVNAPALNSLAEAEDLIRQVADEQQRAELVAKAAERREWLEDKAR